MRWEAGWQRFEQWVHGSKPSFLLWRTIRRYSEDSIGIRAGMIAYFLFFSLFPLLLLLISLAGYLIPPTQAQGVVVRMLSDFPTSVRQMVMDNVLSAYAARGSVTLIGLLALAYAASRVYFALSYALNAIWDATETRAWYRLYLIAFSVVGVSLVLVAGIILLDAISQSFGLVLSPWLPGQFQQDLMSLAAFALGLLGSFLLFVAIYRWVPSRKVGWRYLWPGAAVATGLWKLSKVVFAWYLRTLSSSTAVYGSIGVIITLLLWLYFSAMIVLLGAEVNRVLADWHSHQLAQAATSAPEDRESSAPGAA